MHPSFYPVANKSHLYQRLTHKKQLYFLLSYNHLSSYLRDNLFLCCENISSISILYLLAITATLPRTSPNSSVSSCRHCSYDSASSSGRSRPISSARIALATSPVSSAKKPIRMNISKSDQPLF